jgi:SAM-dependent methyltransferase
MDERSWVPLSIDTEQPSSARIYDYYLGGAHNFAVDRAVADQVIAAWPEGPLIVQANRAFLRRAVQFLVNAGMRQFLDIGSGIPTVGNVHEIAQNLAPETKVVYVDIDPVAVEHSRAILSGNDRTAVIEEDFHRPEHIIEDADTQRMLDFGQPIAVLLIGLVHFFPDDSDPAGVIARLRDAVVPGSYLALAHLTDESRPDLARKVDRIYRDAGLPFYWRTRSKVEALFAGWQLVPPGVVWVPEWHPDSPEDVGDDPTASANYGGVGRKS